MSKKHINLIAEILNLDPSRVKKCTNHSTRKPIKNCYFIEYDGTPTGIYLEDSIHLYMRGIKRVFAYDDSGTPGDQRPALAFEFCDKSDNWFEKYDKPGSKKKDHFQLVLGKPT